MAPEYELLLCHIGVGTRGALLKLVKPEFWWQVVQLTALVLMAAQFEPSCWRYLTGWMLAEVLRWHWVQFMPVAPL
ncbi:MAG: hypothetical protein CVV36_07550 [Candidatus Methanoperedenaceae archaeon HGW-Methanoperedenaceae-1]|nr:MAG: hypothetical protein CVV36_07550 [Candidatus Methanoperedenaceae archaeon HGW-Methanoperedenaceae-1]